MGPGEKSDIRVNSKGIEAQQVRREEAFVSRALVRFLPLSTTFVSLARLAELFMFCLKRRALPVLPVYIARALRSLAGHKRALAPAYINARIGRIV